MDRHAYLIMAHGDFDTLKILLECLDDERNDIFLHVDKKAKVIPWQEIMGSVSKSKCYKIQQTKIRWGAYSQIQCELALLKEAKRHGPYQYYHLLSGSDLPLKTQDEIHTFYQLHQGKEFVQFVNDDMIASKNCYERLRFYSFFQGFSKHSNSFIRLAFEIFNAFSIHFQMLFRMDRMKSLSEKLAFGANWFSISDALVEEVLSKQNWIKQHFRYTRCADEMFLQMIVYNSDFYCNVYHPKREVNFNGNPIQRAIDWDRGNPYVFRLEDLNYLKTSEFLFARKFNSKIDATIIKQVRDLVK